MAADSTIPEQFAWVRDGVPVWYQSSPGPEYRYAGVVDGEPRQLGGGTWVVHLREMERRYRNGERSTVPAASLEAISLRTNDPGHRFELHVQLDAALARVAQLNGVLECAIKEAKRAEVEADRKLAEAKAELEDVRGRLHFAEKAHAEVWNTLKTTTDERDAARAKGAELEKALRDEEERVERRLEDISAVTAERDRLLTERADWQNRYQHEQREREAAVAHAVDLVHQREGLRDLIIVLAGQIEAAGPPLSELAAVREMLASARNIEEGGDRGRDEARALADTADIPW